MLLGRHPCGKKWPDAHFCGARPMRIDSWAGERGREMGNMVSSGPGHDAATAAAAVSCCFHDASLADLIVLAPIQQRRPKLGKRARGRWRCVIGWVTTAGQGAKQVVTERRACIVWSQGFSSIDSLRDLPFPNELFARDAGRWHSAPCRHAAAYGRPSTVEAPSWAVLMPAPDANRRAVARGSSRSSSKQE
jgi:hypothetical protein